jgi:hypothetical protein
VESFSKPGDGFLKSLLRGSEKPLMGFKAGIGF